MVEAASAHWSTYGTTPWTSNDMSSFPTATKIKKFLMANDRFK